MTLNIDAKFEGKLICNLKNDMKNLASFHRPKNGDLILESKMAKLTQNKNSWFNFRKQNGKTNSK